MSRADVTPPYRSACRFVTAINVIRSGDHPFTGSLNMWVWASMSPGNTVARLRSMTRAPVGTLTCASGPTSVMRSPLISTTWFVSIRPAWLSNRRPARTAVTTAGGAHCANPLPGRTHGRTPVRRHGSGACARGAVGGGACAYSPTPTRNAAAMPAERRRVMDWLLILPLEDVVATAMNLLDV